MNSKRMIALARWSFAALALIAIVSVYRRLPHVNQTTVALTLLLLILLLAAKWGLRFAVGVSVAATVCYNYFFLPPIGTFTISDPQNWLALFAFLVTAVTASRLSARIREEAQEARRRQHEVEVLFRLSRDLLQTDKLTELMNHVPAAIARVCGASAVMLYLAAGDRLYQIGATAPSLREGAMLQKLMLLPGASKVEGEHRVAVPLRIGVKPRGVLIVSDSLLSNETFEAMGGLVSIAIDRAEALADVTRGEAAKESERLRGVMLDSITHELRTPLTSIKAAVTTLLAKQALSMKDTAEMLTVIDEESDRLNQLVGQSVEMAQLDTREIHMRVAPHAVAELIQDAEQTCGGLLSGRELRIDIPEDLPMVKADPVWIQKVLYNLLDNAVKYSGAGQPIAITAEAQGEMVHVSVADRGVGIDPMEQSMIFDKFYRAHSQMQRIPGTGMGLAICRAILEAHDGSIDVTSQVGHGSVFTFALPSA